MKSTSFTLPEIPDGMGNEQRELLITQATVHIVCCILEQTVGTALGAGAQPGDLEESGLPLKPYQIVELIQAIQQALRGGQDEIQFSFANTLQVTNAEVREIESKLDPSLQRIASRATTSIEDAGLESMFAGTSDDGEPTVKVIGRLNDAEVEVPGLIISRQRGELFTGYAVASQLEAIANHENVVTLEAPKKLTPHLSSSVSEIQATPTQLQTELPDLGDAPTGKGVIVGIIDNGFNFAHDNFRNPDGTTRVLYLWDQWGGFDEHLTPDGFNSGREFDSTAINNALSTSDPYTELGYGPFGDLDSHGTHVTDIAVGNGRKTGYPGVAPEADIIFVNITGRTLPYETFGDSHAMMEAVDYIFRKADELDKAAVINISLGTHGGPHDGSTPVEQWFDDSSLEKPNRAIVLSAGNSYDRESHVMGTAPTATSTSIMWHIPAGDPTPNELEIWYTGEQRLDMTFRFDGQTFSVPFGRRFEHPDGISVNHKTAYNGDNHINILMAPSVAHPTLELKLRSISGNNVPFHAWVERDNAGRSTLSGADPSYTIGSIACGEKTIAVGAYDPRDSAKSLAFFSAAGPTRDDKEKPEVSAPGFRIVAAVGKEGNACLSGTSMAAPHVAGLVALLIQVADQPLEIDEIRQILMDAARRDPPDGAGTWDPRYGMGRVDAVETLKAVLPVVAPS